MLFSDGCPGGETPEQVGARADRVIARVRAVEGHVALLRTAIFSESLRLGGLGLRSQGGGVIFFSKRRYAKYPELLPRHPGREALERYAHAVGAMRSTNHDEYEEHERAKSDRHDTNAAKSQPLPSSDPFLREMSGVGESTL